VRYPNAECAHCWLAAGHEGEHDHHDPLRCHECWLDVFQLCDTYMREVAHVLDAAREIERHGRQSEIQNIAEWVQRLRGLEAEFSRALAALPVPPTERVRACLQDNGRSLEWPK
jgi:hypothetical protein